MKRRLFIPKTGLVFLALVVGLTGGILLDRQVLSQANSPSGIPTQAMSEFQLMGEAWKTIQQAYVDQKAVKPRRLAYGAISGMVKTLGDTGHSRFLTPEMAWRHQNVIEGEFEGIGAYVEMKNGRVVIVAPLDNSPAQRVGLRPGDIILKVNGEDVTALSLDEVVGRIQGPAGTRVTLTIMDPETENTQKLTVERAEVELDNVTWERPPGSSVAHVRIAAFSKGVSEDLKKTLAEIQEQEISRLILDLRNNPGGLLNEAVEVASQFLEGGDVLLKKDAQGGITPVPVEPGNQVLDIRMVVLTNGGTASAAEIVAGALQDAERATVVGETTFGAGTVLSEFALSDGSVLLLAVEEWRTPDGRVIWHKGLAPDVKVVLPPDTAPLLPLQERDLTPKQLQNSQDTQLLRALDLLNRITSIRGEYVEGFPLGRITEREKSGAR